MAQLVQTRPREFLWGTINAINTAGVLSASFVTPDNIGGSSTHVMSSVPGLYSIGIAQQFALLDLPTTFVDYVENFEQYKIDKVGTAP